MDNAHSIIVVGHDGFGVVWYGGNTFNLHRVRGTGHVESIAFNAVTRYVEIDGEEDPNIEHTPETAVKEAIEILNEWRK